MNNRNLLHKIILGILSFFIYTNASAISKCSYYPGLWQTKGFFSKEHELEFVSKYSKLRQALRKKGYHEINNKKEAQLILKDFTYGCALNGNADFPACEQANASIGISYNNKSTKPKTYKHASSVGSIKEVDFSINTAIKLSIWKIPSCDPIKGLQGTLQD